MLVHVKFTFSEKATKIDKISTVDLTVTSYWQIEGEDCVNFCSLLEKMNFKEELLECKKFDRKLDKLDV